MSSLLPAVKLGASLLAGIPVSKITNDIIKNNVTIITKVDKAKVVAGSVVIGAMISQSVSRTTDAFIDSIVALKNRSEKNEETPILDES
jgi:hypothetical protein